MPWNEVKPMESKILFISDWLRNLFNFSELCRNHGISRKTGYKWVKRYREDPSGWLLERSRRPRTSPLVVPDFVSREILWLRKGHKYWGARKIRGWLLLRRPDWVIPSTTTIHKILKSSNLVAQGKRRSRVVPSARPFASVNRCNQLWTADFKGQFALGDGTICYPLTVMEHFSRFLLACVILPGTRFEDTLRVFEELFATYGLPDRIRTDNGVPFASTAVAGLSKLSLWWLKLGIMPERIESGHPEQNGQHERMHRTLKMSTTEPPARNSKEQQLRFDLFRREYNEERPHESLDQLPPSTRFIPSERKFYGCPIAVEYPVRFTLALVNHNGCISHKGRYVYVGYLLRGVTVGLEEIDHAVWEVYFRSLRLGRFQESPLSPKGSCSALERV